MHFLLIGSGGREHALAWKLLQSEKSTKLTVAPGSDAIAEIAQCVSVDVTNHQAVVDFCKAEDVGCVVVGPEAPLVDGLTDILTAHEIRVFGPDKYAAQLEGSKSFTKALCARENIPTAAYRVFDNARDARAYLETKSFPQVLKADGLAAGKGVIIAQDLNEANDALQMMFSGGFGKAGEQVVIEEFLEGEEASLFVITDGEHIVTLPAAQDHKRAFDNDEGPNTGGMGAYAPAPVMTADIIQAALDKIVTPTLSALKAEGHPYKGVLYTGLMITDEGPKLIEYNVRFGDPECQVLMLLLEEDLGEIILDVANGKLTSRDLTQSQKSGVCIVMASDGYPGDYQKGTIINGLQDADETSNKIAIFHAGTKRLSGNWTANGGRVLNICAVSDNLADCVNDAYQAIDKVTWPEGFFRKDIAHRALTKE